MYIIYFNKLKIKIRIFIWLKRNKESLDEMMNLSEIYINQKIV